MSLKPGMTRRDFLISTALAGASYTIGSLGCQRGVLGANDRIRIGIVGMGTGGLRHLGEYSKIANLEVAALCDTNMNALGHVSADLTRAGFKRPQLLTDFRQVLDNHEIDAISIAVPRALRATLAIDACEAGKDVLIEQPCCNGILEGRNLESIAHKKRRLVQQISNASFLSAPQLLTILATRGGNEILGVTVVQRSTNESGSVNDKKYETSKVLSFIEPSLDCLDLARCLMGGRFPVRVTSSNFTIGGLPNASRVRFLFQGTDSILRTIHFEGRISRQLDRDDRSFFATHRSDPDIHGARLGDPTLDYPSQLNSHLSFLTTQGEFSVSSVSGSSSEPNSQVNDWSNFVSCVRERNIDALQNPIHEARLSSSLVRLAEASLKFRRGFDFDPGRERAVDDSELDAFIQ